MKIALFVFITLYLSTTTRSEEPIRVAFDMAYKPYMYWSSEESKASGVYPQIIAEIYKRLKIDIEMKPMQWKRAVENAEKNIMGVGGVYKNEQRVKLLDFSEPIFTEKNFVFVKKGKQFSFQRLEDLKGKLVGVTKGWSYGEEFDSMRAKKKFNTEESNEISISFGKLVAGKIDCFIVDVVAADKIITSEKFVGQIDMINTPAITAEGFLAFGKGENKIELLKKFNQELIKIKKDGTYDKIIQDSLK